MALFKRIALFFLLCAAVVPAIAQIKTDVGISFGVGIPQAEFGDNLDNLGFGIQLNGAIGIRGIPISVGADFDFMIYGHERRNEPFSQTIPDVTVKVVTDNNLIAGHFFLRLQPDQFRIRPYADALIGFKHLYTDTKITNEGFEEQEIARSTNFDDTALSYGFGAGLQIQVYVSPEDSESSMDVSLDFGLKYLLGSEASYLKEGSIRRENGQVTFDVKQSKTTLLLPYVGVVLSF
jgi:hypothetical protein